MNHKAFTLIELLVVVLIIGILSAIALPQYSQAVEKSRAAEVLSNIGSFTRAVKIWELAHPGTSNKVFTGNSIHAGELDIGIPDDWVQGTSAMMPSTSPNPDNKSCSKNFCYDITSEYVWAHRRSNSSTYKYTIHYRIYNNDYICLPRTSADLKLCKSLSNMSDIWDSL